MYRFLKETYSSNLSDDYYLPKSIKFETQLSKEKEKEKEKENDKENDINVTMLSTWQYIHAESYTLYDYINITDPIQSCNITSMSFWSSTPPLHAISQQYGIHFSPHFLYTVNPYLNATLYLCRERSLLSGLEISTFTKLHKSHIR